MFPSEQLLAMPVPTIVMRDLHMSQMDIKKAAGFLLAGAAVGAAVALLYAPQSGTRTRRELHRFATKTVDRLDDFQSDIRDKVTDWVEDLTETIKDGVGHGKKLGAEGYAQVLRGFDDVRQYVEDGKSRVENMVKKETA
jgi:gas vesicle protein